MRPQGSSPIVLLESDDTSHIDIHIGHSTIQRHPWVSLIPLDPSFVAPEEGGTLLSGRMA